MNICVQSIFYHDCWQKHIFLLRGQRGPLYSLRISRTEFRNQIHCRHADAINGICFSAAICCTIFRHFPTRHFCVQLASNDICRRQLFFNVEAVLPASGKKERNQRMPTTCLHACPWRIEYVARTHKIGRSRFKPASAQNHGQKWQARIVKEHCVFFLLLLRP